MTDISKLQWIVLTVLVLCTAFSIYWPWGLLFIFWSIQSWRTGQVFLIAPVTRQQEPVLFWCISALWLLFGLWELAYDLLWRLGVYQIMGVNIYQGIT